MRNTQDDPQGIKASNMIEAGTPGRSSVPRRLRHAAQLLRPFKWVFALIAIGFLGIAGWDSRSVLADLITDAAPSRIIIALGLGIAAHLFAPICSVAAIRVVGGELSYGYTLAVHLRNLPGRYVPGGVWHTLGRVQDFLADGMKQSHITALVALESAMPVGVGLASSSFLLMAIRERPAFQQLILLAGFIGGVTVLLAVPYIIAKLTHRSLYKINWRRYLMLILVYLMAWVLLAGMFTAYLSSFPASLSDPRVIASGATYIFSWAVGFVAIFAPQGIGVFELTAAYFLRNGMDIGAVAALVAGFRIIPVLADTTGWIGFLIYRAIGKGEYR